MDELFQHPKLIIEVLAAYWIVSAVVTSMPRPSASSYWGTWAYDALHLFVGSIKTFADSKISTLTQTAATGEKTVVKVEETKEKQ